MYLKIQHFVIIATIVLLSSCNDSASLSRIEGGQIEMDSTISSSESIASFFAPYRERIDAVMDSTLAFAPFAISREDGEYNSTAGNLMADIVLSEGDPIFHTRTGEHIDFVFLNYGGIRSIISQGSVTTRSAYEVMPFENSIVVAKLNGKSVQNLVEYLRDAGRPHPISGLQVILNQDNSLRTIRINGQPFDASRSYNVATSNYLFQGGDGMVFFGDAVKTTEIDYKIRNAMIDYFKKTDTVAPVIDQRFYRMN